MSLRRRDRARRGAALIAAGALVLWSLWEVAGAQARVVGVSRYAPVAGPVLAGERVIWATGRSAGSVATVRLGGGGSAAKTVAVFERRDPDVRYGVDLVLAASAQRIAVDTAFSDLFPDPRAAAPTMARPFSGPVGRALRALADECVFPDLSGVDPLGAVAVSENVVAYRGPGCDRLAVRDLSDPSAPVLSLPNDASAPRVAGRYIAYLQGPMRGDQPGEFNAIVVIDRVTQQEVYRVPAGALAHLILGLSLDRDGTIVVTYQSSQRLGSPRRMGIATASPQQPPLRPLLPDSGYYSARVAGGRVVVVRQPGLSSGNVTNGRLELVDPASGQRRTLASPVEDGYRPRFDFDGQRVTWLSRTCTSVRVNVAALDATPGPGREPGHCRLRLTRAPVIKKNRLKLRFSCAGLRADCTPDQPKISSLPAPGRPARVIARRAVVYDPGIVEARLTRAGRRMLSGHRRVRVRVIAGLSDNNRDFEPYVKAPRPRSTTLTLHR